jgi:hypothetical protein
VAAASEEYKDGPAISLLVMLICLPIFPLLMLCRIVAHIDYTHKKIGDCIFKGIVLMIIYLIYVVSMFSSEFSADGLMVFSILLLLPSLYQLNKASRIKRKLHKRFEQYESHFKINNVTTVGKLAELVKKSETVVKNELLHWMYVGVLDYIEIQGNRVLVFGHSYEPSKNQPHVFNEAKNADKLHSQYPSKEAAAPPSKPKPIQCHGCGASTTIMEGETKQCEYCESILS